MRFRGLHSERRDYGPEKRREMIVWTVFATGVLTDARSLWRLMAYSHSGVARVASDVFARSERRAALLKSSP